MVFGTNYDLGVPELSLMDDNDRMSKVRQNLYMSADYQNFSNQIDKTEKKVKDKTVTEVLDSVSNIPQNVGLGTRDLSFTGLTQISNRGKTWQLNLIDQTMRDIPYFINASSWKATVATRNGIDLNADGVSVKEINRVQKKIKRLTNEYYELIYQGEFYGFCGGLIVIDGQDSEKDLLNPIDYDSIGKGDFKGIKVLTRLYQIIPDTQELIQKDDIKDQKYWGNANLIGKPKYYRVFLNGSGTIEKTDFIKVHASRILTYSPFPLSFVESQIEMNMGVSMLERVYSDMARYETLLGQVVKMAQRSNIPVFKTNGLTMATLNSDEQMLNFMKRMKNFKVAMSNSGLVSIDSDEEFNFEVASFQDVPSVVETLKENLASALGAPYNVISHGKTNDKEEEKKYYHIVQKIQNTCMTDWLERLIPIIYKSEFGKDIEDFDFDFKALDVPTQKEQAETLKMVGEVVVNLFDRNIIDIESGQNMLMVSQTNVGDMTNEITKNYIEYAKNGDIRDKKIKNKVNFDLSIAEITNSGGHQPESGRGKDTGGNPQVTKKATPTINPEKK